MKKMILRLDDACERMKSESWQRLEKILDNYNISPLVGVIPHCEDDAMQAYESDSLFWDKVVKWEKKGWCIALHGYNHVYSTRDGGINPVNKRSEFAGESLETQCIKIRDGLKIMRDNGIEPKVFFAPSHTFDMNTLRALEKESQIRTISDTIAWDSYKKNGFTFVPQQSGRVRKLPFKTITFCYHPNTMDDKMFRELETFLSKHNKRFVSFNSVLSTNRKYSFLDKMLNNLYFFLRGIK